MSIVRPAAALVGAAVLLIVATGCVPSDPTPTPSSSRSATPTPTATVPSATPTPTEVEVEVTAAVVVITASTLSVFGTDGSTLAAVDFEMEGDTAAARIAAALEDDPVETPIPEVGGGPCPAATSYDFGGLVLRSPGSLGSAGSFEVIVSSPMTSSGVAVETIAGQRIGAARADFEAAIGEFLVLEDEPAYASLGFDIVNPEAGPGDRIGAVADFAEGTLDVLAAPRQLGFVGSCA
jgi:hypothetical protein